jgi:AcrR family transcriptional regulator
VPPKEPARLGRPARYTVDEVLDAAERLPFEQLTMTALAQELGLVTSALYRYVRDRDDLLAQLRARLAPLLPSPDETLPWDEWVAAAASGIYDLVLAHPVIADLRSWIVFFPTEGKALIDARDRVMANSGLSPADAETLYAAATNLALVYATSQLTLRSMPETLAEAGGVEQLDPLVRTALQEGVALLVDGARRRIENDGR